MHLIGLVAIIGSVIGQVALIYKSHQRGDRMSKLRADNAALNGRIKSLEEQVSATVELRPLQVKPLIFAYLKRLGEHELHFGERLGESERLTLYLHDEASHLFIPLSRFSNSADFCKISREVYPDSEGCLALAWKKEFHFKYDYPNPISQPAAYIQRSAKDNMPEETLSRIRMKSVLYCGQVIWNKQRDQQIGVLMLEATYDRWSENQVSQFIKKEAQGYLGDLIDAMFQP